MLLYDINIIFVNCNQYTISDFFLFKLFLKNIIPLFQENRRLLQGRTTNPEGANSGRTSTSRARASRKGSRSNDAK